MPDSLALHLPSYLDNRMLYHYMKEDFTNLGEEVVCYSQFCRLMKLEFPDVSIPKVQRRFGLERIIDFSSSRFVLQTAPSLQVNRLTRCDICTFLKEEKQKTMDKTLRDYYDKLYKQHNELQR